MLKFRFKILLFQDGELKSDKWIGLCEFENELEGVQQIAAFAVNNTSSREGRRHPEFLEKLERWNHYRIGYMIFPRPQDSYAVIAEVEQVFD